MENLNSKNSDQKENKNETIDELAHRHLKDQTHTTTDEELKNAKVVLSKNVKADEKNLSKVHNTTIIPPLPGENEENPDDEENDKNDKRSLPNPYDILGG